MKKMRNEGAPLKVQARITSRGRVTLPREVRLHMGVGPGDMVEFETDGDNFFIRPVKPYGSRRSSPTRSR
jgi:AbrB family looped-hinge helix DNA binding protein